MKNLKLHEEVKISYYKAENILKDSLYEHEFKCLNETSISDTVSFETVQNRQYFLTKIGRKGTVLNRGTEGEEKAVEGVFEIKMCWDYRHPSNFALNQNNLHKIWNLCI